MLLDNDDEMDVDFSEERIVWEYEKFLCARCGKTFETRRSLKLHIANYPTLGGLPSLVVSFDLPILPVALNFIAFKVNINSFL